MNKRIDLRCFLLICLSGAVSFSLFGATPESAVEDRAASNGAAEATQVLTVTAAQLLDQPQAYRGKVIRLKSHFAETLGPHTFEVSVRGGGGALLVLIPVLRPYALGERLWQQDQGMPVTIVGTVLVFRRQQFEANYDWFSVNLFRKPNLLARWEGRPVMIARSVRTTRGHELVDAVASGLESTQPVSSSRGNARQGTFDRPIQDLATLFAVDFDRLLRMRVLLNDVQVQRVLNSRWLMVGTAGERQILAQLSRTHPRVQIGDRIQLRGVIRRVPASLWMLGLSQEQLALSERPEIFIDADGVEE